MTWPCVVQGIWRSIWKASLMASTFLAATHVCLQVASALAAPITHHTYITEITLGLLGRWPLPRQTTPENETSDMPRPVPESN